LKNKKNTGSFYTPESIASFLVEYLFYKIKNKERVSILEPSAGDGVFIKTIYKHDGLSRKIAKVVAVEQSLIELTKLIQGVNQDSLCAIHSDFLEFQDKYKQLFSLVIGNPPYIKKSLLSKNQIESCRNIHQSANLEDITPKNIWTSFLVRCIEYLEDDGILAFILPSELLKVKYAKELLDLILSKFERVEIFTFRELLFKECKGQDTVILIGEKKSASKGVFYCTIDKINDLKGERFVLIQDVKVNESKWTHFQLEAVEIELLEKLKEELKTVNDLCNSKAGIVTAANDFFIVNEKTVDDYSLHNYVKPIIQKGAFINGNIELSKDDFQLLIDRAKPTYLLTVNKNSNLSSSTDFWNYIKIGEDQNIHKRFKTSIREIWYEVPNVGTPPEAFFFRRCSEYPKLIKNNAKVLTTDCAYTISMKDNFVLDNFLFAFYNSLTLAFAELYGRSYGGGVLELTPNEFKNLPVPYLDILPDDFESFVKDFSVKTTIKEICRKNDIKIFKSIYPDIDLDRIEKVFQIREKLYLRRIKSGG
jgi:adenine-specific DNA-methyltransferase